MADYDHCEVHHLAHPCEACAVELGVRDQFAMAAMQGLLANPGGPIQANGMSGWNFTSCDKNDVAKLAYILADAMLHERTAGVTEARHQTFSQQAPKEDKQ